MSLRGVTCAGLIALGLASANAAPESPGPVIDATEAYRRGDYATALKLLRPLADQGYDSACVIVARLYLDGRGTEKNSAIAAKYLRLAADRGSASAANALAELYSTGEGVPIDPAAAVELWRRAGHLGDPFAAHRLGLELERGIDVPEDRHLALLWLDTAVERLGEADEGVRAQFVSDRDALVADLGPAEIAAAARIVSPEGPTSRAVVRDEAALLEHSQAGIGAAPPTERDTSVVVLLLVDPAGRVSDLRLEGSSGSAATDAATLKVLRGASVEPKRRDGVPVAAWQVLKWTWKPRPKAAP